MSVTQKISCMTLHDLISFRLQHGSVDLHQNQKVTVLTALTYWNYNDYNQSITVLLSIAALYAGLHKHSEMLKHKTRLYETNIYFNTAIIVKMLASRLNKLHYYIT